MRRSNLLQALFPKTREAILAATLMEPARSWYLTDLARTLGVSPSSLQRELSSLVVAEILRRTEDGNRTYYQANTESPIFPDLYGLFVKTAGLHDVIRASLDGLENQIDVAFVYGSLARSEERSSSDIDLMVVGQVRLSDLAPRLKVAEARLNRPVNPSVYPREEIAKKLAHGHHFLSTVMAGEKLFIVGTVDELAPIIGLEQNPNSHNDQDGTRRPS
jgi:DNA-binding transcriptional ArsR family regulator